MQGRGAALITSGSRDNLPKESDNVVDPLVRVVDPLAQQHHYHGNRASHQGKDQPYQGYEASGRQLHLELLDGHPVWCAVGRPADLR